MRYFVLAAGILTTQFLLAQEVPQRVQQQLEDRAEALEQDGEDDQWLQQLEHYKEHPLSINTATDDELRSLRLLTDLQIHNLLKYRAALGRLVDVHELQAVPGWDPALIGRLLPFITVQDGVGVGETLKTRLKGGVHTLLLSNSRVLEGQKGYRELATSHYLGSKDHIQFRYQYRYKNLLQFGLTGDKDAGEPFFREAQDKGFDFYSFHLFARKLGAVKALALGDFTVNLGQGLVHWQSMAFGKSAEVINIKRQSAPLQPYSSAGEYYFNRGAGVTVQKGRVEATVFASYRKLSGNSSTDSVTGQEIITSLQTSGYHRTRLEIEDRNHVDFIAVGGGVAIRRTGFSIGVNGVHHYWEKPLQKREEAYNLFAIRGREWSNYSLDYSATYRNVHLYGEAAVDLRFSRAFVQGLLMSVHPKADVSLLYRHIDAAYQSFAGRAFTENTMPTNEQGLYIGVSLRPHPFYKVDAHADFSRFPWLKYRVDAPSTGRDYSVQVAYQPHKQLEVYARYRFEQKSINSPGADSVLYAVMEVPRHNWRVHADYGISPRFELRARADGVLYRPASPQNEKGRSVLVEGRYRAGGRFSGNLRLQYFSTDSYNSRIYTYESDLLYHYYIPAFYDRGLRYYLRLNWDIGKRLSFWLRWSQTLYNRMEIIGSGLDQIEGSQRSEIKVQARLSI
ncbi:MAG TPA: helix-hairpin-helix domain-containing protein [Chitinophagaceae bacterium]